MTSLRGYVKKGRPANWTAAFPEQAQRLAKAKDSWPPAPAHGHPRRFGGQRPASPGSAVQLRKSHPRRITPKKRRSDRLYNERARIWLWKGGVGRPDAVALALGQGAIKATCVHHARGRLGTLKFDVRFWVATTGANALWPHRNVEAARRLGLIARVGEWCAAPDDAETARIREWMREEGI